MLWLLNFILICHVGCKLLDGFANIRKRINLKFSKVNIFIIYYSLVWENFFISACLRISFVTNLFVVISFPSIRKVQINQLNVDVRGSWNTHDIIFSQIDVTKLVEFLQTQQTNKTKQKSSRKVKNKANQNRIINSNERNKVIWNK